MTHWKKRLLGGLIASGALGVLLGGVASAAQPECYRVHACGCANDGGYLYCIGDC